MRNGFLLVAGLVVVWQALFQFAGAHALSPPLETALYLAHLLGTAQFWGHLLETGRAFAAALLLSVVLGLGIGLPAKIAFGAIHGVIPVAIFAMAGVRQVSPALLRTARVLRLSRTETLRCIVWPAALPEIFSGLRIGFSLTLIGTLLGEMFGSQKGLGHLLMTAIGLQNVPVIMAVTLLLVLFAATLSVALLALDRRLHRAQT